jgi:hypothetical protein
MKWLQSFCPFVGLLQFKLKKVLSYSYKPYIVGEFSSDMSLGQLVAVSHMKICSFRTANGNMPQGLALCLKHQKHKSSIT